VPAPLLFEVNEIWRLRQFLGVSVSSLSNPKNPTARLYSKKIQERTQLSEMVVAPCQNLFNSNRPFTYEKIASSCVSSRLPPNKAPSLMLRINKCELSHTNSYVVNQSYEFVFHLTSSLQPPNNKRCVKPEACRSSSLSRQDFDKKVKLKY
jgi:hypothetical protein